MAQTRFQMSIQPSAFDPEGTDSSYGAAAYARLWRTFMGARILIAVVLLLMQVFVSLTQGSPHHWLIVLSASHLAASAAALGWVRPAGPQELVPTRWMATIGVDLVVFALLQSLQHSGINYAPLYALPVLLASILGSLMLALATASAATFFMLGDAALSAPLFSDLSTSRFLQAGLTGTGFFLIAFLANQLAQRLTREQALAQRSQAAVRTQAQINELVIESLIEGVMVVDRHGVVRHANPAARRMLLGDTPHEGASLLLGGRDNWRSLAVLVESTFAQGMAIQAEVRIDIDHLTVHRLFVRTRPASNQDDQALGQCVLFLEDLREVEARVRTEKLASMGRMSAAVAHEIRNPLSAISQANALLDEEVTDPAHRRLTQMIEKNVRRLARTVDDVLNLARAQPSPGEPGPALVLDTTVRQIATEWSGQHQAKGVLGVHPCAPGLGIAFDPEHLRRLLVNLLDNAWRHASRKNATIRLVTQPSGTDKVRLSVWSDGAPLEPGVMRHLFEPFFSSESRSSGLGLYLCRELCERHGATIGYQRCRLDQQDGNEFFVLAPVVRRTEADLDQPSLLHPPGDTVPDMAHSDLGPLSIHADPP
jgi:two-component system, NtrC family, sensor histidine kinase PilS